MKQVDFHINQEDLKIDPSTTLSQTSTVFHMQNWLQETQQKQVKDSDGHIWNVEIRKPKLINQIEKKEEKFYLYLSTLLSRNNLAQTEVMDQNKDARLLSLINDQKILLYWKSCVFSTNQISLYSICSIKIIEIINKFKIRSFKMIKRNLIYKFIENQAKFGSYL